MNVSVMAGIESSTLTAIAERYGTPTYVYAGDTILANIDSLRAAFAGHRVEVHYALKANSQRKILETIKATGVGADVVSLGELERAVEVGWKPEQILFSGVGKSEQELTKAYQLGIAAVQLESLEEIGDAASIARRSWPLRVGLRINPDIDAKTHPKITTGLYDTKFGIAESDLDRAIAAIAQQPQLKLVGIGCHLGSQIADPQVYRLAYERLLAAVGRLGLASKLEYIDLGGGFAYDYNTSQHVDFAHYARAVEPQASKLQLVLELGRSLVVNAGGLLTRVIRTKQTPHKNFAIVDASMTELLRPALYDAFHAIEPVVNRGGPTTLYDVVGPVCETSDTLGSGRALDIRVGDLLMVRDVGAYGASMASNYNLRPRPAEVLVTGQSVELVTDREHLCSLR